MWTAAICCCIKEKPWVLWNRTRKTSRAAHLLTRLWLARWKMRLRQRLRAEQKPPHLLRAARVTPFWQGLSLQSAGAWHRRPRELQMMLSKSLAGPERISPSVTS
uniref:Uncharacterized protein n=1 Tax=Meleagris gallopavo TaxID=9103 RepID=A0A803XSN2_MELGA